MTAVCKHCGRPESAHHAFEPILGRPAGCVCYGLTNKPIIHPICDEFTPHNVWLYCTYCKHDEACHNEVTT